MATTTGSVWGDIIETGNTVTTNKGTKTLKKCAKCDETITEEESCPKCNSLTEDAKPILLD